MPDRDVVLAKVAVIQRCMRRIKESTGLDTSALENIDKQDIFVLNLQRAVQAAIDLAAHIVASEGLGLPDAIKDNFRLIKNAGIINDDIALKMEAMSGFRNIAIHDYRAIDIGVLKSIMAKHLRDLEDFYTSVLLYFKISAG